jgi:hypothetical protein
MSAFIGLFMAENKGTYNNLHSSADKAILFKGLFRINEMIAPAPS